MREEASHGRYVWGNNDVDHFRGNEKLLKCVGRVMVHSELHFENMAGLLCKDWIVGQKQVISK